MLRVAVAAAGDLLLESIQTCLKDNTGMDSHIIRSTSELLSSIQSGEVDALILDDQYDPSIYVGDLVTEFKKLAPNLIIIIIGTFADGLFIYELFEAGASGYLYRGDELRGLIEAALETACASRPYLSPTASSEYAVTMQTAHRLNWRLDTKLRRVLNLLANGLSPVEIAAKLEETPRHVYWLQTKLRNRFNVTTTGAVVAAAMRQGYLRGNKDWQQ